MCGIFGKISAVPVDNLEQLKKQRDLMSHRGPDAGGLWVSRDGKTILGHRRLAIIDLSENANQPMVSDDGSFVIVFNGEIYNFQEIRDELTGLGWTFRTASDTEVVMNAFRQWGTECLNRFTGMFAFAIFDNTSRRIFIARDRAGEKPLFYSLVDHGFIFASELKTIMAEPCFKRVINPNALDCFLSFGYIPGEYCILKGVNKLPPAHAAIYDPENASFQSWRYWSLPDIEASAEEADEECLFHEFEELLQQSVKQQLVADVPVGILLSGGLDSSLITAMAVRNSQKVKTFTIRFPGHGKFDETSHARIVAKHFATEHLELDAGETSPDLLSVLARQFDEPMVDSSMIPTFLVSQLVRKHCTVALGGDGGDELFGGYAHYSHFLRMKSLLGEIPAGLRRILARSAELLLPLGTKGRNWFSMAGIDFDRSVPVVGSLFGTDDRRKMVSGINFLVAGAGDRIWQSRTPDSSCLVGRYTRMDFGNYLPEDILVKVDRASMLNSVEMRAPFLYHRLVEFAFSKVPARLKVDGGQKKIFLKKAAARLLPSELEINRKQGFSVPLQKWIKKPEWHSLIMETLLAQDSFFDRSFVKKLIKFNYAFVDNAERLFALTMFELWRRTYNVRFE